MSARSRAMELVDDGIVDVEEMLLAALKYMSEDEVADMLAINQYDELDYDDRQPTTYEEYQDLPWGGDDMFETCSYMEEV